VALFAISFFVMVATCSFSNSGVFCCSPREKQPQALCQTPEQAAKAFERLTGYFLKTIILLEDRNKSLKKYF
jgi:hypothetical protein